MAIARISDIVLLFQVLYWFIELDWGGNVIACVSCFRVGYWYEASVEKIKRNSVEKHRSINETRRKREGSGRKRIEPRKQYNDSSCGFVFTGKELSESPAVNLRSHSTPMDNEGRVRTLRSLSMLELGSSF
ncbi:hypothetical protein BYT27DRAFT_6774503 [Phlegmacium glaucopus]|nr:hypothetical protein BYT27DRAFT_6774503 [Phlegmacium glaucopus]